jgi:poly(A) polymerase/tRNA nucleotidyltransferase (CCA-adding enzyme)
VRFVGDPATRLAEDYLRALRFFRFQARYGRGAPDAAAVAAIRDAVPGLARLSAERVWMELKRILSVPEPMAALQLMAETGVLGAVLPEGRLPGLLPVLIAIGAPPVPVLRMAGLIEAASQAAAVARRLRLSGTEAAWLAALLGAAEVEDADRSGIAPGLSEADLRRMLARADRHWRGIDARELLVARSWLAQARPREGAVLADGDRAAWAALRAQIMAEPVPVFPLAGRDALALGLPPGKAMGEALEAVRQWWLARGCADDHAACVLELHRIWAVRGGGTALGG